MGTSAAAADADAHGGGGGGGGMFQVDEADVPDDDDSANVAATPAVIDHVTEILPFSLDDEFDYDNVALTANPWASPAGQPPPPMPPSDA